MRNTILVLVAATFILVGCSSSKSLLTKTGWLIGTWQSNTSKGKLFETWTKETGNSFSAKSYYLNNADTIIFETIELTERNDNLFYIVNAPKEKNEKPVSFKSVEITNEVFIFENKQHDFPQVISYKRITSDSLHAEISGNIDGAIHREQFP